MIDWSKFAALNEDQVEDKVEEIFSKLNGKEKAQMMSGDWTLVKKGISMLIRYNSKPIPAGVIKRLGIPGVLFTDGPRGVVMGSSTCFPVSMARGASWDIDLEERIGNVIGIEGRTQGNNFFGGVCINLLRHPAWGRAQETYGEDSFHLGEMGAALTRGVQKHMMACAKHYACNSMENARFKVDVKIDERTLREIYLPHFKRCIDQGIASVMNAYNKVNGKYCGHNPHLLTQILKQDWNFKGFVITDFILGIRSGALAVNAGVDIEMPFKWRMKPKKLLKLLKKGIITAKQIDESCKRILRQLIKFIPKGDSKSYTMDKVACKEHVDLALETARKSIVLLKNEGNILPLKAEKIKRIAVLGKLASIGNIGDLGSSRVYPPYIRTPLEGIFLKAGENVKVVYDEGRELQLIEKLVESVDVVIIVVGFTHSDEGEYVGNKGGDRDSLELRHKDEKLILEAVKHNKNCIVILEGGSSIITEDWRDKVPVILMAWYPGMEGGNAIADVLFGDFNPCAKLPVAFPKSLNQLPFFDKNARSIEYGHYHGYRLMDKESFEPAFPFGFGLSYTTYTYKNLTLDKNSMNKDGEIKVNVEVTNEGDVAGEEIVQMYIGYKGSAVERPIKELKGFKKVSLKPKESKIVSLNLKVKDLAYYNVDKKDWIVEDIDYIISVGSSSRMEDLLSANFKIS